MELLTNFPLIVSVLSIFLAQFVKVPLHFLASRKFDWGLLTSTGGMPSSHSAAVTALSTALAIQEGLDSPLFAISAIFGVIVMFDASGVRRHAGETATVLNALVSDFNKLLEELKTWPEKEKQQKRKELKELLGHQPIEVFFGGLLGIIVAFVFYQIFY